MKAIYPKRKKRQSQADCMLLFLLYTHIVNAYHKGPGSSIHLVQQDLIERGKAFGLVNYSGKNDDE